MEETSILITTPIPTTSSNINRPQQQSSNNHVHNNPFEKRRVMMIVLSLFAVILILGVSTPSSSSSSGHSRQMLRPGDGNFFKSSIDTSDDFGLAPDVQNDSNNKLPKPPKTQKRKEQRVSPSSPSSSSSSSSSSSVFWTRGTGGRISPTESPALKQSSSSPNTPLPLTSGCEVRPNVEREGFLIQCPLIGKSATNPGKYTINPLFVKGNGGSISFVVEFSSAFSISSIMATKCKQYIDSSFAHVPTPNPVLHRPLVPSDDCSSGMRATLKLRGSGESNNRNKIDVAIDVGDDDSRVDQTIRQILIDSKSTSSTFDDLDYSVFNSLRVVMEVDFKVKVAAVSSSSSVSRWRTCFISIGDWGGFNDNSLKVANLMEEVIGNRPEIRFIVSTGDNFYPTGVKSVNDPQFKTVYERLYSGQHTKPLMWVISLGNHDQWGFMGQLQYGQMVSNRWYFPKGFFGLKFPLINTAEPTSSQSSSKNNVGDIAVIAVLDTYARNLDLQFTELPKIISSKLPQPTSDNEQQKFWKIVVGHIPIFSGSNHGKEPRVMSQRPRYKDLFYKAKVNAYLNGDDHLLEVHRVKHDDGVSDATIDFFTSGAGGGNHFYDSTVSSTTHLTYPFSTGFMVHCFESDNLEEMTTEFYMINRKDVKTEGNVKNSDEAKRQVPLVRTKLQM